MSWLSEALHEAASNAHISEFPIAQHIREGIAHYLENDCPLTQLPIEDLFSKIRHMLKRIGFDHVAEKLQTVAPPITISLVNVASQIDPGFEIAFFLKLREEVSNLRSHGAAVVSFEDLEQCVLLLKQRKKWTKACTVLENEIVSFVHALENGKQTAAAIC